MYREKNAVVLFFISNLFFLPFHSHAQNEPGVDTVKIVCIYEQVTVLDTLNPQKKVNNLMLLQIGNHCSKYYSFYQYLTDSVIYVMTKKINETGQMVSSQELSNEFLKIPNKMPEGLNYTIFKNYPTKSQLSLRDHFGFDRFMYEEPLPNMQWQLRNDTLTVCGYLCKKAICAFRGRNYTAWYTDEIPVSNGPWKFNGLPGLILKVIDDQRYFSFECTAIETPQEIKPIVDLGGHNRKISRTEYNKAKQRYMDSPGAYVSGSPMTPTSPLSANAYKKRPYHPIERTDE